jgi:hypothetical protein
LGEVDQQLPLEGVHGRADRNGDHEVSTPRSVLALRGAVGSVHRAAKGVLDEAEEGSLIMVGDQPHVPTPAPVTPVGAALRDVGLAAKRDATGPAVARLGVELSGVDETGHG